MYALANVEKFLNDNSNIIDLEERDAILERAREQAKPDGILVAGRSNELWQNRHLEEHFGYTLSHDVSHMDIGLTAIRAAH